MIPAWLWWPAFISAVSLLGFCIWGLLHISRFHDILAQLENHLNFRKQRRHLRREIRTMR